MRLVRQRVRPVVVIGTGGSRRLSPGSVEGERRRDVSGILLEHAAVRARSERGESRTEEKDRTGDPLWIDKAAVAHTIPPVACYLTSVFVAFGAGAADFDSGEVARAVATASLCSAPALRAPS